MKIGILTFHNGINYGAVLQAYSLKEFMSTEFNISVNVIDYRSKEIDKQYGYTDYRSCGSIRKWIAHNATYFLINRRKMRAFRKFDKYLSLTPSVSSEEVINNKLRLTHIIVGSDQVWNQYSANDDTFFLTGMSDDIIKIGYAISVGNSDNILEYSLARNESVYKFDALSFREKTTSNVFSERFNINCRQVLDPTLLLSYDYWSERLVLNCKEKYVFLYNLRKSKFLVRTAKKISKMYELNLYVCNASFDGEMNTLFQGTNKSCVDPFEFMNLIMNSQYVVTDSFHGVAISILLHKEFFVELNPNKYNTNERIVDLLNKLDLLDRVIKQDEEFWNVNQIDYYRVEEALRIDREASRNYLMENIKLCASSVQ